MDHSCAAGSLRWRWSTESDLIHPQAQHFSNASRAASIKNERRRHTRVLALYDICVASSHAQPPHDKPIAMYPPRGEEEAEYMWQMKRAMYGTRRASRHIRVQWAVRHAVLCETTERDDDETTKAGQSSTGQAGEISRAHAEAHAQIRSSGVR